MKHENHTPTGAFKVRGGLVCMERLKRENPDIPGVISATRGNHGQSLAYAERRHGVPVTILVPQGNSVEKNAAMRAFGARLIEHGEDFEAARLEAMRLATIARGLGGEVLRAELCEERGGLVYRITLIDGRGSVRRVVLDARDGRVVYDGRRP